eukprot:3530830-Rhodomonas_salina.4
MMQTRYTSSSSSTLVAGLPFAASPCSWYLHTSLRTKHHTQAGIVTYHARRQPESAPGIAYNAHTSKQIAQPSSTGVGGMEGRSGGSRLPRTAALLVMAYPESVPYTDTARCTPKSHTSTRSFSLLCPMNVAAVCVRSRCAGQHQDIKLTPKSTKLLVQRALRMRSLVFDFGVQQARVYPLGASPSADFSASRPSSASIASPPNSPGITPRNQRHQTMCAAQTGHGNAVA